ncbi:AP-3 complex subunit delta [Pseudolycoriella hygida]|uniref:AP-3 complex subunit delta n=1 Tax=Pseudolycoriella hygida TaxID=35572 RepID=A0A9Q0MUX7_9DIPT|nr:AP-3 complex subunit delta [Pseudolycoriella hygida]
MALKKVKGNFERFFDKTLTDLVRGIRNNKDNEAKYIAQCIEEVKQELRQDNINVKCNAVAKLTYIQMLGYDISWAGFNIIEVMSSSKFTCKRVGYLAASQCFHPDSELIMLTTNMIRKDLNSQTQYDAGVALSGLSCFISSDLSRDLANDIMTLCSSTKPYLRMKAVLMMYKVFLRYPEALRPAFPKLKEKLEDPDPGVQSAAVNVICELARKNPKNYLSLAPIFFKLMTTSTNNWMLIKIIKLFASLTTIEPALGYKLSEPLIAIIASTSAMSLLYECINTVIAVLISISSGMPNHTASIQLCVQKLRILIEDSDQNLKYLGLLAMSKILKTHPKSVQAHKDLILACLDDKDESIRLRALDLLFCGKGGGMVSKKNLMEIVRRLLGHMERAEGSAYRDELLFKVIQICSQGSYQYVTNFEWYLTVLVELIQLEAGSKHGSVIAKQLLDVSIRVQDVRQFAVSEMTSLLESFPETTQSGSMFEVLYAAAWIVGEFSSDSNEPERSLNVLLKHRSLPGHIQGVYIQNILKLFTRIVTDLLEQKDVQGILRLCNLLLKKLPTYVSSSHIEVQERASSAFVLIEMLRDQLNLVSDSQSHVILSQVPTIESSEIAIGAIEIVQEMALLFAGDLNPVAPKAQKKVQIPEGLNLDEWINTPPAESSESSEDEQTDLFVSHEQTENSDRKTKTVELTPEEIMKLREVRKMEQSHNPNYLKSTTKPNQIVKDGCEDIPIAELALEVPLKITSTKRSDKYLQEDQLASKKKTKKTKKTKKSKHKLGISSESDGDEPVAIHSVSNFIEMPEGASLSDNDEKDKHDINDPHRALDIDLDLPLRNDEILPKQSYKKFNEITPQLTANIVTKTEVISTDKSIREKKEKKRDKERGSKKKAKRNSENEPDLMGTPVKHQKEKHKKEKKDKKAKEKKVKDSKTGYEEAIGISTPSKEVY